MVIPKCVDREPNERQFSQGIWVEFIIEKVVNFLQRVCEDLGRMSPRRLDPEVIENLCNVVESKISKMSS